jgi:putative transposase
LHKFTGKLHGTATRWANRRDGTPGRQVWFSYYPVKLTYERSYLARLNYVRQNPVRHGVVLEATQYPYCSAAWFEQNADWAWYQTVTSFPIDNVHVEDDF